MDFPSRFPTTTDRHSSMTYRRWQRNDFRNSVGSDDLGLGVGRAIEIAAGEHHCFGPAHHETECDLAPNPAVGPGHDVALANCFVAQFGQGTITLWCAQAAQAGGGASHDAEPLRLDVSIGCSQALLGLLDMREAVAPERIAHTLTL